MAAGELTDVRAAAHLDDHGQSVDIDAGPYHADQQEENIQNM